MRCWLVHERRHRDDAHLVQHLPGVSNVTPDRLSRRKAPRKPGARPWSLPSSLAHVEETKVSVRDESFYETLSVFT